MRCSRHSCWRSCRITGGWRGQGCGYFPAAIPSCPSQHVSSTGSCVILPKRLGSRSAYRPTYCAIHLRRICMSRAPISAQSKFYSEQRHTANEQPAEARIAYRYHPRFGEVVQIRRRLESGGIEFVVVLQPDGSFACLPAWLIEPAASRFGIGDEAHFPLQILRSMRAEVEALLGFLRSESKTETADNGAQIRKSPTKSVRRGDAARGAVAASEGRARRPRGSTAPRDCRDAGRRKQRGERS